MTSKISNDFYTFLFSEISTTHNSKVGLVTSFHFFSFGFLCKCNFKFKIKFRK